MPKRRRPVDPSDPYFYKERFGEFGIYKRLPEGQFAKLAIAESEDYAIQIVDALIIVENLK